MRYDDHDTFGSETTGGATLAWAATPTTLVRATYGEGFKAPTLFQLFSDFGNEDLAPERADAWDVGVEQHLLNDALSLSATYFSRDTRRHDRLRLVLPGDRSALRRAAFRLLRQRAKTEAEGVELGLLARVGERLSVDVNYTDMDTKNRGAENFGLELARRPGQTLNGELTYDWAFGLTTTVAVTHAGRTSTTRRTPSSSTLTPWSTCARRTRCARTSSCTAGSRTPSTKSTKPSRVTARRDAACSSECDRVLTEGQRMLPGSSHGTQC